MALLIDLNTNPETNLSKPRTFIEAHANREAHHADK